MADAMLRASLTRTDTNSASVASVATATPPPTYRSSRSAAGTGSSVPRIPTSGRVDIVKSDSERRTAIVSEAEAKLKVRELQREVERANAKYSGRSAKGLFKSACSTDLLFLIDTTASMGPYIGEAKDQIRRIVADIKKAFLNESQVRISVVGYKDHEDTPHIQFLDFTPSVDQVHQFLDKLQATGGGDTPEDVLGAVRQALNASWKQQTRCIIHIADAPPHGHDLHDLNEASDNYYEPGSEPHHLTYERLLQQLVQLRINYALLRINSLTDRMALVFGSMYAAGRATVKLLPSNGYHDEMDSLQASELTPGMKFRSSITSAAPQFEELQLGTSYSSLRHLVVQSVTNSVSRTATRLTMALSSRPSEKPINSAANLFEIVEDEGGGGDAGDGSLEPARPQWDTPGWLTETLLVEGFWPDVVMHDASTLNDMMDADENIKLSFAELSIQARPRAFAKGTMRAASYARTMASTNRFVVKSFLKGGGKGLPYFVEDMRIQALCKAFALEFNGLLNNEHPIDFISTTCLQTKSDTTPGDGCLSLEPFIEGEYIKYNNNGLFVREDSPDDQFNRIAQAFSHFTFERSWGDFLINDLQGVGNQLTDPSIQTRDPERFKLNDTNLNEDGFKFFFVSHKCNEICKILELKSSGEMLVSGNLEFRERWPTMDPTVCCSNKLCRRIIRLASAHKSAKFPGLHWCDMCWPQLESTTTRWYCVAPGPDHEFDVSKFFYESQGKGMPRKCPEHQEKDASASSPAAVGGSLWSRMKSVDRKPTLSGRVR